jgi:hypothetical protein
VDCGNYVKVEDMSQTFKKGEKFATTYYENKNTLATEIYG